MILNRGFIRFFSLVCMVLIVISPSYGFGLCESDVENARSAMESAEDALGSAYRSLLKAERSGGDVSDLVMVLNTALLYYSEARKAFVSGEYERAIRLAGNVVEASNAVLEADFSVMVVAVHLGWVEFRNQLFLSSSVVCFIILFGFLGWRLFKGFYVRRMMGLRPEVVTDES